MSEPLNESVANAIRDGNIEPDNYDGSHKIRICYNRTCPDYRRKRTAYEECKCRKTTVPGKSGSQVF